MDATDDLTNSVPIVSSDLTWPGHMDMAQKKNYTSESDDRIHRIERRPQLRT